MAEKLKSKLPDGVEEFLAVYAPYMDSVAGSKPSEKYKPDQDMLERQHEMAMEFLNSMRRSGGSPSVRYSSGGGGGGGSPSMGGGYVPPPMETITQPAVTPAPAPEVTTPEVVAPPTDSYTFKREEPTKKAEKKEDDEGGLSPLLGLIPGALAGSWLWGKNAGKQARKFVIPWGDAPAGKAPQKQLTGKAPQKLLEGDGFLKHFEQQGTGKPMTPEDFLKYYMGKAASDKTPLKDVKDIGDLPSLSPKWTKAKGGSGVKVNMRDKAGENHYGGRGSLYVFEDNVLDYEFGRLMDEAKAKGEVPDVDKSFSKYFGDDSDVYNKYKRSAFKDATDEELNAMGERGKPHSSLVGGLREDSNSPKKKPIIDIERQMWREDPVEGELLPKPKELQPTSPTKTKPIIDAEFEEWQLPVRKGKTPLLENAIEGGMDDTLVEFGNEKPFTDFGASINPKDQKTINKLHGSQAMAEKEAEHQWNILQIQAADDAQKNGTSYAVELARLMGLLPPSTRQAVEGLMTKEKNTKSGSPSFNFNPESSQTGRSSYDEMLGALTNPERIGKLRDAAQESTVSFKPSKQSVEDAMWLEDNENYTNLMRGINNDYRRNSLVREGQKQANNLNKEWKAKSLSPKEIAELTDYVKQREKELTSGSKGELEVPEGLPPELKQLEDSGVLENILRQLEELKGKFGDTLPMEDQKMASFGNEKAFQLSPEIKKMLSKEKNMSTIKRMLEDMRNKGK